MQLLYSFLLPVSTRGEASSASGLLPVALVFGTPTAVAGVARILSLFIGHFDLDRYRAPIAG